MLAYKSEIRPKNHLPHAKSDCIGFKITSGIPVVSYVSYGSRKAEIRPQMGARKSDCN